MATRERSCAFFKIVLTAGWAASLTRISIRLYRFPEDGSRLSQHRPCLNLAWIAAVFVAEAISRLMVDEAIYDPMLP
jgi:hypothetical protein